MTSLFSKSCCIDTLHEYFGHGKQAIIDNGNRGLGQYGEGRLESCNKIVRNGTINNSRKMSQGTMGYEVFLSRMDFR